jgi:hypothetical protein
MAVSAGFTIVAFSRHATILSFLINIEADVGLNGFTLFSRYSLFSFHIRLPSPISSGN